jgi:tRNA 2-thiouridine synthesizing protein A
MSTSIESSTPSPPPRPGSGDADAGELDLRGEVCPYTFVRARLALEPLPRGAVLTLVIDHPPALRNLPRSLADWGQAVEVVAGEAAPWRLRVVKRAP